MSNNALPNGWCQAPLDELAESHLGKMLDRAKNSGDLRAYLRNINVRWGGFDLDNLLEMRFTEAELDRYAIRKGDVVVCEGGEPGRCAVWREDTEVQFQKALHRVRPRPGVLPDWIALQLRHAASSGALQELFTGTTIKHLTGRSLRRLQILVPPTNEQRRIVAKIEALQARSRRAREALEAVPPLLENFRQSVLAAAFRGDLTADWRANNPNVEPASKLLERIRIERRRRWEEAELAKMEAKGKPPKNDKWKAKYKEPEPVDPTGLPELPEAWCWASLDELLVGGPTNGFSGKVGHGGTRTLRLSATTQGEMVISAETTKELTVALKDDSKFWLEPGDLLVQRANSLQYLGAAAIYSGPRKTYSYPDLMMRLRIASRDVRVWVWRCLNSQVCREFFRSRATGTAGSMPKINGKILRATAIPVAPAREMEWALRSINQSLRAVNEATRATMGALSMQLMLDESILAKAFRGDLVPQDPDDEPAFILLDRIRSERTGEQKTKKRSRKTEASR